MTLNIGQDFKKRWLTAPDAVRQAFLADLYRVNDLLKPETQIQSWLDNDQRAQQVAQLQIEQAYADEKARLIEQARVRKQQALENALAEKRAQQYAFDQSLLQDEIHQFHQQTESLVQLRNVIDLEITDYSERYTQNPALPSIDYARGQFHVTDDQIQSELESVRLRLELEAETFIEESVAAFRSKLQTAAAEEISYILKQTQLNE